MSDADYIKTSMIIRDATDVAKQSTCAKSRRGVVIFSRSMPLRIYGWNHPPKHTVCGNNEACMQHCNKICIHAEAHALQCLALELDRLAPDRHSCMAPREPHAFELLHIKIDQHGNPLPSGEPSCWQCSRQILDASELFRITKVWLVHEPFEPKSYTPLEFHKLTLEHHGMPLHVARRTSNCDNCGDRGFVVDGAGEWHRCSYCGPV